MEVAAFPRASHSEEAPPEILRGCPDSTVLGSSRWTGRLGAHQDGPSCRGTGSVHGGRAPQNRGLPRATHLVGGHGAP